MNLKTICLCANMMKKKLSLFIVLIFLLVMMATPPASSALQEATLSVDPPSGTMTSPTYTINVRISSITNLWAIHFQLSFNNGTDFLQVDIPGGVEPGDLMTPQATVDSHVASIDDISYLDVTVLAPNWETNGTITGQGSIAKVTFQLTENAQPDMTSWLKLEKADATVLTGGNFEPVQLTLESGYWIKVGFLTTTLTLNVPSTATLGKTIDISANLTDGDGNPIASQTIDFYVNSLQLSDGTNANGIASIAYAPNEVGTLNVQAVYNGSVIYAGSSDTATITVSIDPIWLLLLLLYWLLALLFGFPIIP